MRADGVTPAVREAVIKRDGGCVAALLNAEDVCRDRWRTAISRHDQSGLTLDHVHEGYGMAGKRAKSDPDHLVTLCWGHGVQRWELANKDRLRRYIVHVQSGMRAVDAARQVLREDREAARATD